MSQLELNGVQTVIDSSFQTWRELLRDLESKHLTENQVIASVRFDGDEVTQFRIDEVLDLPLQSIEAISVQSVATKEMLRDAVTEAEGYLMSLETSMVDVAETFRTGHPDQANLKLQHAFEGVKMLIALLRGIELSLAPTVPLDAGVVEQTVQKMSTTLEDLIASQTQKDWTLVADLLEYELVAHLSGFESVLSGFKPQLSLS